MSGLGPNGVDGVTVRTPWNQFQKTVAELKSRQHRVPTTPVKELYEVFKTAEPLAPMALPYTFIAQ